MADEVPEGPDADADEVVEGSMAFGAGANSRQSSEGFWCRLTADEVRRVVVQMADKVPEGSGSSKWFWFIQMVLVQKADKVAAVSDAHSRHNSGGLRYKHFPRSSKLLEITHEFIPNVPTVLSSDVMQ